MQDAAFQLLGEPRFEPEGEVRPFPAKGFQLLGLLAARHPAHTPRGEAAALLWPEKSDANALTNLRQLLVTIRAALPSWEPPITGNRDLLWLTPNARIDVLQFRAAAAGEDAEQHVEALPLFGGDLLQGMRLSDELAERLARPRAELHELFFATAASVLKHVTRFGRSEADTIAAIGARMLALDVDREQTYRELIDAYGRSGNFEEAQRVMATLTARLRDLRDATPSRETAATARRVFAAAAVQPDAPVESPVARAVPRIAILLPTWLKKDSRRGIVRALLEDVANELSRYRTFVVLAPHTTFRIRHSFGDPQGEVPVDADYLASSFVKPGGDGLAMRLVHRGTGEILWAGDFPLDPAHLDVTFRTASAQIATSLAAEVERDVLRSSGRTAVSGAYHSYLKGQAQMRICDLRGLRRAREAFRGAITADDGFASAHARIAQTQYLEWLTLGGDDPILLNAARERAESAVRRDPGAGLGHLMVGVTALYQREFDVAAERFVEAEALSPNNADLLVEYADALALLGEPDAGWLKFLKAIELNPLPPDHYWWAGASISFAQGNYAKTLELCSRVKNDESVLKLRVASHAHLGDMRTASAFGTQLRELYPGKTAVELLRLVPFRNASDLDPVVEGLRMAGLP